MSPRTVRRLVIGVFVIGIAGMIAGSIADNNGFAITFGLITAAAAVGLILVTAVAATRGLRTRRGPAVPPRRGARSPSRSTRRPPPLVEEQVGQLVVGRGRRGPGAGAGAPRRHAWAGAVDEPAGAVDEPAGAVDEPPATGWAP